MIVAGETGSGKSTQLPKLCLELGRQRIGHTQPRRIAARAVAERVAEELGVELGGLVGYAVRFTDKVGPDTRLKLMTDGILLNELQRDRELERYDTIIVDEAHERSLNIDFILGYLRQLLPRRPDLKVIVTSATIDTERFAAHFETEAGPAPVIEVTGRTYPVEIRYQPVDEDGDETQAIADAVETLLREVPGDVLVFQSGEREIRDTADAIEALEPARHRGAPAVRSPVGRRAAPGVRLPSRSPRRHRHQHRRDVADRARHPVGGRPGDRSDLPVQQADQGPAAAHRGRVAGVGRSAGRPVRAGCARGVHPALRRGRLRRARPSSPSPRSCARTWRR